jgi:hypothetical protein
LISSDSFPCNSPIFLYGFATYALRARHPCLFQTNRV